MTITSITTTMPPATCNGSIWTVTTYHQTKLVADVTSGKVLHASHSFPGSHMILFRPVRRPELGFLCAENMKTTFGRSPLAKVFHLLFLGPHPSSDDITLREPLSNFLVTSLVDSKKIVFDTTTAKEWEGFRLLQTNISQSSSLQRTIGHIAEFVERLSCIPELVSFIQNIPDELIQPFIEAALLLLHDEPIGRLCSDLLGWEPSTGAELPPQAPNISGKILNHIDPAPWFAESRKALQDWAALRHLSKGQPTGAAYDFFGINEGPENFTATSPGHRFLRHARRLIEPQSELALLATARDEGLYLLEWLAHHRIMGIQHVFLYTNNNTDGSDLLLSALAEAGVISWLDNSGTVTTNINMQTKAYAHALSAMPEILDYRWTLALDLDEFILPHPFWGNDLAAILRTRAAQKADSVAFQWHVFYPDHQLVWSDAPCAKRYTRSGPHPLVKSAFRTNRFAFADAHHPAPRQDEARVWLTADGNVQYGNGASNDSAWINGSSYNGLICHFAIKSLEEFVWKYARGENDGSGVLIKKRFRYNNPAVISAFANFFFNSVGDRKGHLEPILSRLTAEIDILKRLPGVRAAYEDVVKNYQTQIEDLVLNSLDVVGLDPRFSLQEKQQWNHLIDLWQEQRHLRLSS